MQFKKIVAAGSMAALMVGSSVAFAALQDLPAPFVTAGTPNFLVVVGAVAATSDVVGAVDIAARFGGESTRELTVGASSGGVTVTGEGKGTATTNTKVYLHDNMKKAGLRSTMTSQDLATTLKTGILQDTDANDEYKYDQYIEFSDDYVMNYTQYVDSSLVAADPELVIKHQAGASNPTNPHNDDYFYKARVVFQKNVNGSTAANEKLNIFGQDYTISSSTTFIAGGNSNKLVLFGSANTQVLTEKEKIAVTVGGKTYDVTLNGVSSTTEVVLTVGGTADTITKGTTKTIGGLQVYLENVFYYGSTRTDNQAKLGFGAQQLNLQHNNKVSTGSGTTTNIDGTYVNLSVSSGKLNSIEIYTAPTKTSMDVAKIGGEFVDPVFGTFKVKYASATPGLTDSARGLLETRNSGDDALQSTYTDDRGNTATFTWAYDADSIDLEDSSGSKIHVRENEDMFVNEYAVLDAGDFTHMVRLTSLSNDGTSTGKAEFTDVFTQTKYEVTLGQANSSTWYLDGQAYYVNGTNNTAAVHITWGDGAGLTSVGNEITVFPVLKGRQGQYIALTRPSQEVNLSAGNNTLWLPTGKVTIESIVVAGTNYMRAIAVSGYSIGSTATTTWNATASANRAVYVGKTATGGAWYNIAGTGGIHSTRVSLMNAAGTANQSEETILLRTEGDKDSNEWNVIVPAANDTISGTVKIQAGTPEFTYDEQAIAMKSDTQKTRYLDKFGVFAERDARDQDTVKVWYPDEQMTNDVFVLAKDATVTTTAAAAGTKVKEAVPIKTAVAKLDTEVTSADKSGKNLILVGGPAANTLVADLATNGKTKNTQWYRDNGAGTALIELVADAFTTGKSALVVAGYEAAETRVATGVVQNYDGNTDKLKGVRAILKGGVWTSETV